MDSFESTIEQYKRELMKYAKKNGAAYSGNENGFSTVPASSQPNQQTAQSVSKPYRSEYVKNRPMPSEYDGSEDVNEETQMQVPPAATVPTPVEPAIPAVTDELTGEMSAERKYRNYDDFIGENPQTGKLRVQTYAARQAFPISNAKVSVEKDFLEGTYSFNETLTDIDGIVENIILPTKDKSLSLVPGNSIPYSTYTVRVEHPQFTPQVFYNVPIFDSIESLQPVPMLPSNGRPRVADEVVEREPNL